MPLVTQIPNDDWVSVNSLSGFGNGERLFLLNVGSSPLVLQTSATKPLNTDTSGKPLNPETSLSTILQHGFDELWVRAFDTSYKGELLVEDPTKFNDSDNGIDPRVYKGNQGLTIQPFTEANVKNGTQFTISEEIPIPQASTVYRAFKTPNDGRDILIKTRIINTDGGMRYTPHAGQTGVVQGVDKTDQIVNLNSKSSNTSGCQYYEVLSTTDDGPFFDVVRSAIGQGNNVEQGIFSGLGIERVLNPDTEYLLKFENLDTNTDIYVVFSITFYSGPLSVDII